MRSGTVKTALEAVGVKVLINSGVKPRKGKRFLFVGAG